MFRYEYWDSINQFDEPYLPLKEKFFSHLTRENIFDDDYNYAQKEWTEIKMQKLVDYNDLYIKTDVLLFSDVFETLRSMCMLH